MKLTNSDLNTIIREVSGRNALKNAIDDWKNTKLTVTVFTIIIVLICFGIMYLRFRVFGG